MFFSRNPQTQNEITPETIEPEGTTIQVVEAPKLMRLAEAERGWRESHERQQALLRERMDCEKALPQAQAAISAARAAVARCSTSEERREALEGLDKAQRESEFLTGQVRCLNDLITEEQKVGGKAKSEFDRLTERSRTLRSWIEGMRPVLDFHRETVRKASNNLRHEEGRLRKEIERLASSRSYATSRARRRRRRNQPGGSAHVPALEAEQRRFEHHRDSDPVWSLS